MHDLHAMYAMSCPTSCTGRPPCVPSVSWRVGYRWAGSFVGLVSVLTRYFQDMDAQCDPERVYLWLDFMAVDQHARVDVSTLPILVFCTREGGAYVPYHMAVDQHARADVSGPCLCVRIDSLACSLSTMR